MTQIIEVFFFRWLKELNRRIEPFSEYDSQIFFNFLNMTFLRNWFFEYDSKNELFL